MTRSKTVQEVRRGAREHGYHTLEENPVADLGIDPTLDRRNNLPGGEGIPLSSVDPVVGMMMIVILELR